MRLKVLTAVGGAALVAALLIPGLVIASGSANDLKANMTGAKVVPKGNGAPHGTGRALITLQPSKGKVCFNISWTRVGSKQATGADIFAGKPGSNGNRAATLFTKKQASPAKGCAPISSANSKDIRKNPGLFNVIVTTSKYPHGAIRGQLKRR